jgi:hypothetical protein
LHFRQHMLKHKILHWKVASIPVFKTLLIYVCNKTNLMHYLFSVYWFTTPLQVSCFLVAHYQEVIMYTCNNWYVLYVYIITSWWWATRKPGTCTGVVTQCSEDIQCTMLVLLHKTKHKTLTLITDAMSH